MPDGKDAYYAVHLQVRDVFYLKQRLLACGLPFRVLAPQAFKEEMQATLQAMLAMYLPPNDAHAQKEAKEDADGRC